MDELLSDIPLAGLLDLHETWLIPRSEERDTCALSSAPTRARGEMSERTAIDLQMINLLLSYVLPVQYLVG